MANRLTINFTECTPAPALGYHFYYRELGSVDPYIDAGLFPGSPAIIDDLAGTDGEEYEGYFQSVCGDGDLGAEIPFEITAPPIPSGELVLRNPDVGMSFDAIVGLTNAGITYPTTTIGDTVGTWSNFPGGNIDVTISCTVDGQLVIFINNVANQSVNYSSSGTYTLVGVDPFVNGDSIRIENEPTP